MAHLCSVQSCKDLFSRIVLTLSVGGADHRYNSLEDALMSNPVYAGLPGLAELAAAPLPAKPSGYMPQSGRHAKVLEMYIKAAQVAPSGFDADVQVGFGNPASPRLPLLRYVEAYCPLPRLPRQICGSYWCLLLLRCILGGAWGLVQRLERVRQSDRLFHCCAAVSSR